MYFPVLLVVSWNSVKVHSSYLVVCLHICELAVIRNVHLSVTWVERNCTLNFSTSLGMRCLRIGIILEGEKTDIIVSTYRHCFSQRPYLLKHTQFRFILLFNRKLNCISHNCTSFPFVSTPPFPKSNIESHLKFIQWPPYVKVTFLFLL